MDDLFVDRNADVTREFFITEEGALHASLLHETGGRAVNFARGNTRCGEIGETVEDLRSGLSCPPHFVDFGPAFNRNHTSTS
jgi:hypothetical protein